MFIFVDLVLGQHLQPGSAVAVLLLVTVPSLLIPLRVTFGSLVAPYLQRTIFISCLVMSLSLVWVVLLGTATTPGFPYESLFLVTFYVYFLSGLFFYQALVVGLSTWLVFVLGSHLQGPPPLALYEGYYLLVANSIGAMGLYFFEQINRRAFLLEHELRLLAVQDGLTKLLNRRAFHEHLHRAWLQAQREGASVGLMMLDLDHLKQLNDEHGHMFGDRVLQQLADALKAELRRPLDAAGRFGGDEFVAVWFNPNPDWFAGVGDRVRQALAVLAEGPVKAVTVSGGAVLARPGAALTARECMRLADERLYDAKSAGRNAVLYRTLSAE